MSVISTIFERTGLANLFGFQMGGLRDLYGTFGWKQSPRHIDFIRKYKRQAVARRVVNAYPDALWSDPPILVGDDAFNAAWQNLLAELPVFSYMQKLDKLCGLGTYAILVVGLDDGKDLKEPISPVVDASKPVRKVIYLQPYAEGSVDIIQYETNTDSARYGLPVLYRVSPGNFNIDGTTIKNTMTLAERSFSVHWTRVLHVAEGSLESSVFGTSRLEPIYNDLDDLEKISGGSAEVFWLNSRQGMHVDVDKDMELKKADAEALSEEIEEYTNQLRRVIRTRGVKVNSLGSDFLDPSHVYEVSISNIASCTGIPKRVLMGAEAGQLASQQDRANWANRVEERISEYGSPVVLLPFVRLLIDARVLTPPKSLVVTWPDAFKMSPLERAQTSAQMARSAANLAKTLFTVQQINHANAVDSMPTVMPAGGGFGGGFGANALTDPSKSSSGTSKTPSGAPPDAAGSGNADSQSKAQTVTTPALFDTKPPTLVLLTEDECRQIIGFGKHMPVFDSTQDSTAAVGSPKSSTNPIPSNG
jgi:hypothetical protein